MSRLPSTPTIAQRRHDAQKRPRSASTERSALRQCPTPRARRRTPLVRVGETATGSGQRRRAEPVPNTRTSSTSVRGGETRDREIRVLGLVTDFDELLREERAVATDEVLLLQARLYVVVQVARQGLVARREARHRLQNHRLIIERKREDVVLVLPRERPARA